VVRRPAAMFLVASLGLAVACAPTASQPDTRTTVPSASTGASPPPLTIPVPPANTGATSPTTVPIGGGVAGPRAPVLKRLVPAEAVAGVAFNPQTDGSSTIVLEADNIGPGTVAFFDGTPLPTGLDDQAQLIALLDPTLLAAPGQHAIALRNGYGESAALTWRVVAPP
jgi:hypothetical protein